MAGDWIKMRLNLVTHPKVMRLAECLLDSKEYTDWAALSYGIPGYPPQPDDVNKRERYEALRVTRYVTVCALLRFWGYANEHVEQDETVSGLWPDDVDEIVGVPSFSDALVAVGWIKFNSETGIATLPNFHKYNAPIGSRGKTNAERQRAYRERHKAENRNEISNGQSNVTSNARVEKRRKDNTSGFSAFWESYPRKVAKGAALKAWEKLSPNDALQEKILMALAAAQWSSDEEFIPHPATWLNRTQWEDSQTPKTLRVAL